MADARRAQLKDQTDISGARALIVEARFYDDIQDALLEGAVAELKGAGVMTIGAEMRVGSVAESVTVTGESPVVDIQTARQQMVIDGDVVRALPASRSYGNYIAALPAIQATGFGSGAATINPSFANAQYRASAAPIHLYGNVRRSGSRSSSTAGASTAGAGRRRRWPW